MRKTHCKIQGRFYVPQVKIKVRYLKTKIENEKNPC